MSRPTRSISSYDRAHSLCEPLERRVLLSTINWVNQGNDNFIFFGANQNVARTIVQRAIADWERVIVNFRYDDNGPGLNNTFNLTLNAGQLGFGERGVCNVTARDDAIDRKPTAATITIDDDGGGLGWYFDPTIGTANQPDDGEYTQPVNLFTANVPLGGPTGSDFYRTVLHEIGHAMGIGNSNGFLKIADFLVDSGFADPAAPAERLLTMNTFGGPAPEYTLTTAGGGHLWEGDGPGGINLPEHPNDLMNPGRAVPGGVNRRQLISETNALLLADVYNYQIADPSQINTFFANLNTTTQVLTINGDLVFANDFIDLEYSGGASSTFQLSNGSLATEVIANSAFHTIVVNSGGGDDVVEINGLAPGKTVTVNLGDGNDAAVFAAEGRNMNSIGSNVTVNGGAGTNGAVFRDDNGPVGGSWTLGGGSVNKGARTYTLNGMQTWTLHGNAQSDTFTVHSTPAGTTVTLMGNAGTDFLVYDNTANSVGSNYTIGGGVLMRVGFGAINYASSIEIVRIEASNHNDTITFNPGDSYPLIALNGHGGNDSIIIDDRADTGADSYYMLGNLFNKSIAGLPGGGNLPYTQISGAESITLHANHGNNLIEVYNDDVTTMRIFGNGGNDTVNVYDGTAFVNTGPETPSAVFPFGDSIHVNPDASTGEDFPATVIIDQDDVVYDLNVTSDETIGTLRILPGAALVRSGGAIGLTGVIDLAGGALLVRAPGPSAQGWHAGIAAGYNGGAWNGTPVGGSINSSLAASTPFGDGVGFGFGSQIGIATIGSYSIGPNDALLRYTRYGDADLNGTVNLADFNRLAANFGQSPRFWWQGNFNYDTTVNLADFNLLAANFGQAASVAQLFPGKEPFDESSVPDRLLRELK